MAFRCRDLALIISIVLLVLSSIIRTADSAYCNRTCPSGWTADHLIYPFGFSEGCEIPLNCTESGEILIGDFRVQEVNEDGIKVYVPPMCSRPIETVLQFYGNNYAPSLQNFFLILNCSFSSVYACPLLQRQIDDMLRSADCKYTSNTNVRCVSDGYKPVADLLDYVKENGTDCRLLFSSIGVKESPPVMEVVKLGWWLEGDCNCSPNTNCIFLSVPSGKTGYRCQCKKGFKGDGYPDSLGCQEDEGSFIKIIVISVGLAAMLLLGLSTIKYIWNKKGRIGFYQENVNQNEDLELPLYNLSTIVTATNNFSADNKLGEGGFGPVYKGTLEEGQEIAVKRLSKSSKQGLKEFMNEVVFIAKLQHRNLVKLLGCCIEGDEKMLIYEYMPNKSLDSFIFDSTKRETLDWPKRMDIVNGIARGLIYLHQDSRLRIIHRDLKASNILLDRDLNPKISDFGLARSFGGNETEANTNKIVGTYGYMPPEYMIDGLYSIKSDVFSFGVLVLETISGKRNRGFKDDEDHLNLLGHAWKLYTEGRYLELIHNSMRDTVNPSQALRLIHVGLLCVQQNAEDRPSISSVLLMLNGEGTLSQPKQPGFYIMRDLVQHKSSASNQMPDSVNEITMTPVWGR